MKIERWYWFLAFLYVSLCIHIGMAFYSRSFATPVPPQPVQLDVALEPLPEPKPEIKPQPKEPPVPGGS